MKNPGFFLLAMLAMALLIGTASCSRTAPTPTPTITPTPTPLPTPTSTPTPIPPPRPTLQAGQNMLFITVNGVKRLYFLYIPPDLNRLQAVPVVFAFHGWSQGAYDMIYTTQFEPIADRNGFLVVYPDGIEASWNAGTCCGGAMKKNMDEAAFIRQILSDLEMVV